MFNATIHGYPVSFDEQDGWRSNEAMLEKFLRRNCTPGVEPDPDQVNPENRKDLAVPATVDEHAQLLAAVEYFGAFVRLEAQPAPTTTAAPSAPAQS